MQFAPHHLLITFYPKRDLHAEFPFIPFCLPHSRLALSFALYLPDTVNPTYKTIPIFPACPQEIHRAIPSHTKYGLSM